MIESRRIGHKPAKGVNLTPFQEHEKGKKSRDLVAKYTGVSTGQLNKEKKIVQAVRKNPEAEIEKSPMSEKPAIKFGEILEKVDKGRMKGCTN